MSSKYELDDKVKMKLRAQIYTMEKENLKDKKLTDTAMTHEIIKLIEKEARKCY